MVHYILALHSLILSWRGLYSVTFHQSINNRAKDETGSGISLEQLEERWARPDEEDDVHQR